MKVKIFGVGVQESAQETDSLEEFLEKRVNDWLSTRPTVKIIFAMQSSCIAAVLDKIIGGTQLTIFYEE